MPFWHGDALGRPLELGRALGAFLREVGSATPEAGLERARAAGSDEWGAANLAAYLAEQKQATGHLPDDRTLLVERFRDELGDWRLVVHSPFGAQVNAPWSLVLAARLRERYGRTSPRCTPTTASCCGCPTPPASRPRPTSPSSTRTTSSGR